MFSDPVLKQDGNVYWIKSQLSVCITDLETDSKYG